MCARSGCSGPLRQSPAERYIIIIITADALFMLVADAFQGMPVPPGHRR